MKSFDRKLLAGMAVTILALATVAPFAEAGTYRRRTSNSDYYRGPVIIHRSYPSGGRYYYRSGSNVGPVLAGFFGGLLLGAVLTNRSNTRAAVSTTTIARIAATTATAVTAIGPISAMTATTAATITAVTTATTIGTTGTTTTAGTTGTTVAIATTTRMTIVN